MLGINKWKQDTVNAVYTLLDRRLNMKDAATTSKLVEVADRARKTATRVFMLEAQVRELTSEVRKLKKKRGKKRTK